MAKKAAFLKAWVRAPLKMGAIVPSSNHLAHAMVKQIEADKPGYILELGAGTGVMTRALIDAGIAPERLLIMEREKRLCKLLAARFPQLSIIRADAMHLDKTLQEKGVTSVNAIISSLPLLSMPRLLQKAIIAQMFNAIGNTGTLVQFTYGIGSPIAEEDIKECKIKAKRVQRIWLNVPPATVWSYKKR